MSYFLLCKTKEQVTTPEKEKISIRVQLKAVMQNRPYLLALVGQVLFGFTLYGRNADVLYYFTYVEGNASYYTTYSMCIIIPSIIGAACFQPVFRKLNNKGRTASLFALLTGISMLAMYFFNVKESPAAFYALAGITQFFFSGFNTAIYAIIPDCVEYGEWKTVFATMVSSMRSYPSETRLEWRSEQRSLRRFWENTVMWQTRPRIQPCSAS